MSRSASALPRPAAKFFYVDAEKYLIRGVTYGTFAPDAPGGYPALAQVRADFAQMRAANINTLRVYTEPPRELLDEAERHELKVIVGLAWTQHVCFLDDDALVKEIRASVRASVRRISDHPAVLGFALGNEIPAPIVRWHGKAAIEAFLHLLYDDVKREAPNALCTYVNFPPTDYLELPFLDFVCFNVFLHALADFRAYLAKLQHITGNRPLVLSELGMDSLREGEDEQASHLATHIRAAFADGVAGVCVFSFTDDWWRGGLQVLDWRFGVVDAQRRPKLAYAALREAWQAVPFAEAAKRTWPKVSVVVCAYNAAATLEDNLSSLMRLAYPDVEVIVVNDGSQDATLQIAERFPVKIISVPNGGLSAARNLGLHAASGEIIAYTDSDTRVDRDWLSHLVQPLLSNKFAGVGGPNVVPPDDCWVAQCVARAPGGPIHVMLDNVTAEHIPGCNMAFRRAALLAIGGFDPTYTKAGDDVDICWRLQDAGFSLGFAPGALVWHHHRASVAAYVRQQIGYGEGESFLFHRHTDRFNARGYMRWSGRIYSQLPAYRTLFQQVIYQGRFGVEPFPLTHQGGLSLWSALPHLIEWHLFTLFLCLAGMFNSTLWWVAGATACATWLGCVQHAWASKIDDVAAPAERWRYRCLITWLHWLQPWARFRGRILGHFSAKNVSPAGRVLLADAARLRSLATLKLIFLRVDERLWDTRYTPIDGVLVRLRELAGGALAPVRSDAGYSSDYDLVLRAGRAFAFRVKLTAEDHGGMNRLFRARLALDRPWLPRLAACVGLGLLAAFLSHVTLDYPGWMLLEAAVGAALFWFVHNRVSVYGGQVLHVIKVACREHEIQLPTESPHGTRSGASEQPKPDPQHTVAS
ncbi:MAG TPA: glycosyltransferase [Polyangiales bacterium]|nr:glycosyltransferase [Polyangiales bacterium]